MSEDMGNAKAEVARARVELNRAGELKDFAAQLAQLDAAIDAKAQALEWRQRGLEEVECAARTLRLAEVASQPPLTVHVDAAGRFVLMAWHLR